MRDETKKLPEKSSVFSLLFHVIGQAPIIPYGAIFGEAELWISSP